MIPSLKELIQLYISTILNHLPNQEATHQHCNAKDRLNLPIKMFFGRYNTSLKGILSFSYK